MTDKFNLKVFTNKDIEDMNDINEEKVRDTEEYRTSSLLADAAIVDEGLLRRTSGRREVMNYLDNIIADKVSEKMAAGIDNIDEELERISKDRQLKREALRAARETHQHAKRGHKRKEQEIPDSKVDSFIDGIFARVHIIFKDLNGRMDYIATRLVTKAAGFGASIAKAAKIPAVIIEVEAKSSEKLAMYVNQVDDYNDKIVDKATVFYEIFKQRWNFSREWAEGHKKLLLGAFTACAVTAAMAAIFIGNMTAYEYMYNGKVLGMVKDQQDVYMTIDIIGDKLTYAYGAEIQIDKDEDISFHRVMGWSLDTDDKDDVLNTLTYLRDMNANAYAICVDGKQITILDSKKSANEILQAIKDRYSAKSDSVEYTSIDFTEKVEIEEINTKIGNIDKEDAALEYMLTGAVEKKVHVVQAGDTFNQVAKDYGLKASELQASNPEARPEELHIGQELVLTRVCPVLTVETKEIATYTANIDYEITYEETSALYQGEQTVKSAGIAGQRKVVAEIVRNNGVEVSRNEISTEVLSEPKSQVVLKGTKEVPPLIGTGSFIYPTRGTLTSRFGPRWGRMHYGIDLGAPKGTKIRAADGGTVIYAGWDGALGYTVRIDHGGNRTTVYGHCSKILVSKGDKVYQGQHIANVGSTGNSTGPHLHFEVRINGVAKNPLKYLN